MNYGTYRTANTALGILLAVSASSLAAEQMKSLEFRNQPVTDILMVLADIGGKSIVPDETVNGNATYYFSDTDFDEAFRVFLSSCRLYSREERGVIYVSRINTVFDPEKSVVTLDTEDVAIDFVIRSLSRALMKTILFDALPRVQMTLHVKDAAPEKVLGMLITQFPDYRLEQDGDYYYLKRIPQEISAQAVQEKTKEAVKANPDGTFTLEIDRVRLPDVLDGLFLRTGREYSLFLRPDIMLENLKFTGKQFDEALRLILDQAGGDWTISNGVYYIYEIEKRDILKKLNSTMLLPLTYLSAQDLQNLLPEELSRQSFLRIDRSSNSVILSGSVEETAPIEAFIRSVDRPLSGRTYSRFDLSYQKVKDILPLLPSKFTQPQAIPDANAFLVLLSPGTRDELEAFLSLVDRKTDGTVVRLRYIRTETLLKNLPPSACREDIVETGVPGTFFFLGGEEKLSRFLKDLALLDIPVPQIRYDLLVVQYERKQGLDWNMKSGDGISANPIAEGATNAVIGTLGNLLSLNLDIISSFGYQFAANFSLQLSEDSARVLADTTLNGLSGEEIRFQNTTTDRYRDFEIDAETGKLKSTGVTRELSSGLIVTMNGWTSGDGMITMKVAATVSRQGTDTKEGNPPTTYEKVVQTNVRTKSGEPVVIGGLLQQHEDVTEKKVPLLGDIPVFGLLFRSKGITTSDTEFVLYIIPRLDGAEPCVERTVEDRIRKLYERFVAPEAEVRS